MYSIVFYLVCKRFVREYESKQNVTYVQTGPRFLAPWDQCPLQSRLYPAFAGHGTYFRVLGVEMHFWSPYSRPEGSRWMTGASQGRTYDVWGPEDHINIRILHTMVSGIPLGLGLKAGM